MTKRQAKKIYVISGLYAGHTYRDSSIQKAIDLTYRWYGAECHERLLWKQYRRRCSGCERVIYAEYPTFCTAGCESTYFTCTQ